MKVKNKIRLNEEIISTSAQLLTVTTTRSVRGRKRKR